MEDLVRASVHYYNSEDEVDALVAALASWRELASPKEGGPGAGDVSAGGGRIFHL